MNTFSEYTHFYISKNITSYTVFLPVFKSVESLQCILKKHEPKKIIFYSPQLKCT